MSFSTESDDYRKNFQIVVLLVLSMLFSVKISVGYKELQPLGP